MTDIGVDDDWIELERAAKTNAPLADVQARITFKSNRFGMSQRAKSTLVFRRGAAEWIFANEPRFRVLVGGPSENKLRLTPDKDGGKFEARNMKGSAVISLGYVNVWPNEMREATEAKFTIANGSMIVELPEAFARARGGVQAVVPAPIAKASPSTASPARIMGEPAPGRSALDQRQATSAKAASLRDGPATLAELVGRKKGAPL